MSVQNILALINLAAFVFSVIVLWKTMRAMEKQTERTSKPVICLRRRTFSPSDLDLLEPQLNVEAMIPFSLRNVANGTALEVDWRFKNETGQELMHGMIPNLRRVDHYMGTALNAAQVGLREGVSRIFECEPRLVSNPSFRTNS